MHLSRVFNFFAFLKKLLRLKNSRIINIFEIASTFFGSPIFLSGDLPLFSLFFFQKTFWWSLLAKMAQNSRLLLPPKFVSWLETSKFFFGFMKYAFLVSYSSLLHRKKHFFYRPLASTKQSLVKFFVCPSSLFLSPEFSFPTKAIFHFKKKSPPPLIFDSISFSLKQIYNISPF